MKFYNTVDVMRRNPPLFSDPFIVQWESPYGDERRYIVFDGIDEYLKYHRQGRYTSCHEVLISQSYSIDDDIYGHPAFDIDAEDMSIDVNSMIYQLKMDIISILCKQYPNHTDRITSVLSDDSNWVWMSSTSSKKISKHLVIKSICFTMWRQQMKVLCKELISLNKIYSPYIDQGIMRRLGSLRLPLNHKRHTYDSDGNIVSISPTIVFDNPNHKFQDGLIMIHDSNMYTMVNCHTLSPGDMDQSYIEVYNIPIVSTMSNQCEAGDVDENLLVQAFNRIDKLYNTGLEPTTVSPNGYLSLVRRRPGICPISGREHDNIGAYMFQDGCKVLYGCHRGCTITIEGKDKKCIDITPWTGISSQDNAMIINATID